MTTFEDGPAKGQHLMLRRAVKFLRVVEENGKFDALDQPEDTPKTTETIYAYVIVGEPGMCHIRSGKKGASGFYTIANYKLVPVQPSEQIMRSTDMWKGWCSEQ